MLTTSNKVMFSGGPVVAYEDNAYQNKSGRFVLMGTIHGAFSKCGNDIPGIFVEVDDMTILDFLYKEAYGSCMYIGIPHC